MWPSKHVKSKAVASYTQRLSHRPSIVWNPPALRNDQIGLRPSPPWERLELEDGVVSESSSGEINFSGPSHSSQCEPIVIEDEYDDWSVAEEVDAEDVNEEVGSAMTTSERQKWYKGVLEALAETGTHQSGRLFRGLPVEIHQHISSFLPTARDVTKYAQACKNTHASINDSVWRKRFECEFDSIPGAKTPEMAKKYRFRYSVSRAWTVFDLKKYAIRTDDEIREKIRVFQTQCQNNCLELLKTLIIESNARKVRDINGDEIVDGLNFHFIREMLTDDRKPDDDKIWSCHFVDIVDSILSTAGALDYQKDIRNLVTASKPGSLVYIVQLALTPFSLHPDHCNSKVSHFDISQAQAYATTKQQPIFVGKVKQDINVRWLLHTVNFFKYHFKSGGGGSEGIIADDYSSLERDQYPQPWVGSIKAGSQPLGRFWKGAHTFMDTRDLNALRMEKTQSLSHIYSDCSDPGESFPDMEIFFDESKFPSTKWPINWERRLRSNPFIDHNTTLANASSRRISPRKGHFIPPAKQPQILTFYGIAHGSKPAHFFGRLHALPQQQGLHGFQRIVLMKMYLDADGEYNMEQHFCYEGCVLPGGKVIVGRWWDTWADPSEDTTASGPFIWWNVDRSAAGLTAAMQDADGNPIAPGDETLAFFEEVPK